MSLKDFKDKVLNYNDSDPTTERNEHYKKSKIQPWDVIDDHELNFYLGNAIKYVLRAGKKNLIKNNDIQDLKKAKDYLEKEISNRENK